MANETEQIWHEFHERLRAFIARRVDNEADMKDILQTVFLRLHQNLGTLNRADRLTSWLFQITRHAIADYYRSSERQREIPTDFMPEPEIDLDFAYPGYYHRSFRCRRLQRESHRGTLELSPSPSSPPSSALP